MRYTFLLSLLLGLSSILFGQSTIDQSNVIKPIGVEAKVLGILESHSALVVIQVTRVDPNNTINLTEGSEVLVEFVFGTKKSNSDPKLPGVNAEDSIKGEIDGKFNPSSGQWDYRIFRYSIVSQ